MDSPLAVLDKDGNVDGHVTGWNPTGFGEVIVQYLDGSADSAFFSELSFADRTAASDELRRREP